MICKMEMWLNVSGQTLAIKPSCRGLRSQVLHWRSLMGSGSPHHITSHESTKLHFVVIVSFFVQCGICWSCLCKSPGLQQMMLQSKSMSVKSRTLPEQGLIQSILQQTGSCKAERYASPQLSYFVQTDSLMLMITGSWLLIIAKGIH
jgi:hypothetical protein